MRDASTISLWLTASCIPVLSISDLDMVILYDKQNMQKLAKHLETIAWRSPIIISSAKVPLIKFEERTTGLSIDISFNQTAGLQSGIVATMLFKEMPGLCSLVVKEIDLVKNFVLRTWALIP